MKPFNLERALAGDKVITLGGEKIIAIYHLKEMAKDNVLAIINDDLLRLYYPHGNYYEDFTLSHHDLFMADPEPKVTTYWANVYLCHFSHEYKCFGAYVSEDEAKLPINKASFSLIYLKTISVTVEE